MPAVSNTSLGWFQELIEEARDCWQKLPNKAFFLGLFAVWVTLFEFLGHRSFNFTKTPSIFAWMWGAYNSPALESEHGKLIPVAVVALLWVKRHEILEHAGKAWWPALIGFCMSLGLHVVGYAIQQPRLSLIAFFCGIYSLFALAWGYRFARTCFFPFILFAFCIPLGNSLQSITVPLRLFATSVTRVIASVIGIPLIQQGSQLMDPEGGYGYEIVAACSGIRSLIPVIAITLIYAMLSFKSIPKRLVIIGFAVPLAIGCNVFRVLAIVLTRNIMDEHAALFVHEWFGFVTYLLTLAGAFLMGIFLNRNRPNDVLKERLA